MFIKRLLFENLFAKILSLVVSVLLWFYVSEQQQFEETLSISLRLENIPEELTLLGGMPSQVEILVRGQGRFLRHRVKGLHLAVDMSGSAKGKYIRRLTPADVTVPLEEDVEVLEIVSPGLLKVDLDQIAVKSVPVLPTTVNSPAQGYARVGAPVVNPEQVMIRGAETIVSGVNSLRTDPISLKGATRMVVARARVDLGGLERVGCEPEQVAVALPVEKIESLTLGNIQVVAETDTIRWNIRWQPGEVEIALRGPVSLMVGLRETPPVIRIDATRLDDGRYFFDAVLDERGGMALVSREPSLPDTADTTSVVGPPPPPAEAIQLEVTFDLPQGMTATEMRPTRFHIVVEERGSESLREDGLILPPS